MKTKIRETKFNILKEWFKKRKKNFFSSLFFLFLSASCTLPLFFTSNFKIDYFSYKINDYNTNVKSNGFVEPILTIKKANQDSSDTNNIYPDLYRQFYYGFLVSSIRQVSVEGFELFNDSNLIGRIHVQQAFTIANSESSDGGYVLEGNLFRVYYPDGILDGASCRSARFNCDSFCFISDTVADYLLEKHNLHSYLDILNDEQYCVLPFTGEDGQTYKLSINNIVYSNKMTASRCKEFDNFFVLGYYNAKLKDAIHFQFEIDLKSSPYSISSTLKIVHTLGYKTSNSSITFKTWSKQESKYKNRSDLDNYYLNVYKNNNDVLCHSIFFMAITASLLLFYYLNAYKYRFLRIFPTIYFCTLYFLLFNIIASFYYNYYLFSLCPLLLLIETFVIYLIRNKNTLNGKSILSKNLFEENYYEIGI